MANAISTRGLPQEEQELFDFPTDSLSTLEAALSAAWRPGVEPTFKCLRKTAGDLVRRFSDGEVSGVFLLHGSPVSSDRLSDVYTNRPFGRVYRAIQSVESYLAPVFAESTNPIAEKPQPFTPGDTAAQIAHLHSMGKSVREIQAVVGLSKSAIHRQIQKLQSTKTPRKNAT